MYVLPFLSELSPLSIYKIEGAAVAGFEPSWVLVVTWINLAPYQNWRCRYNNFYTVGDDKDDYYYYDYFQNSDYEAECRRQAEQSAANVSRQL